MARITIILLCLLLPTLSFAQHHKNADFNSISSPDGHITVTLSEEDGIPYYSVTVDNQPFIEKSRLGFETKGGENFKDHLVGFETAKTHKMGKPQVWQQPWGENKTIECHYKHLWRSYISKTSDRLGSVLFCVEIRVFNDGFAFRYQIPSNNIDTLLITNELTEFNFAEDATSWSIPANFDSYEYLYRTQSLSALDNANTPMTFRTVSGIYGSIHEAALTNYPEMTLLRTDSLRFRARLASWPDGVKARISREQFVNPARTVPWNDDTLSNRCFNTPWRTVQIGRQAVDLINSNLILNLNEPCKIEGDLSWIRPMKYIGVWWGMHLGIQSWTMDERHGATTANAIRYIDFAAANNIDAVLFEGWNEGWETWGGRQNFDFTKPYADFDMDSIVRYAASKGVAVISHHETGGNIYNYERQLERTYQWVEDHGIHCVKTGYAGGLPDGHSHHGQYNVQHYRRVVETAAAHHVMLDVHEPIKPTGLRRTYPNMMTREGVRGMEWNAWSEGNPPAHHEILPFTRMLAGPLDYTPGTFDILFDSTRNLPTHQKWNDNDKGNSRVHTTICKQLANWVIFYSPLQMASDLIENYEGHPCFQFFRDFNPDCDWSQALQGEIGEYVVIVRRAGDKFFLGASTNEEPRTVRVPLTFLPKGKKFEVTIYADAPDANWETNPTAYVIEKKTVTRKDVLEIRMAPGGGQAASFVETKKLRN